VTFPKNHADFLDELFRLADVHLPMLGDAQRAPFLQSVSALTRSLYGVLEERDSLIVLLTNALERSTPLVAENLALAEEVERLRKVVDGIGNSEDFAGYYEWTQQLVTSHSDHILATETDRGSETP
jgi:hypothetical protein